MKNNTLRRTSLIFTISATLSGFGCDGTSPPAQTDPEAQELIGGFPAGDKRLDFVGALVAYDPSSPNSPFNTPQAFCSAALVGAESVLTAKHCARVLSEISYYGLKAGFAIGANSAAPSRIIPIVDYDEAPGNTGGFVGMGQDVAVVHLESPVTDIAPVVPKSLTAQQIGQKMVAIGYGVMDNSGKSGERRVGAQTVRAVEGRVFEALFGSFEKFYEWFSSQGYYSSSYASNATMDGGRPVPTDGGGAGGSGGGGGGGKGGSGGMGPDGGVGGGDGGYYPPYDPTAFARYIYESTVLLSGDEAVTGGRPGDAQPCYGDSGSPLIRFNAQTSSYEAWGVVSGGVGSSKSICDFGTVYATFGEQVLQYVNTSAKWTDPCQDLDQVGACEGNVASRCTSLGEGTRRISSLDCDLLGLQCQSSVNGISCGDTMLAPPPAPMGDPKNAPDFAQVANKSFSVK